MALAALARVRPLIDARAPWCVTIYGEAAAWLHGNHLPEPARAQVRTAVRMLLDGGAPAPVVAQIRGQLDQLAKPRADHEARSHRVHGVGIFATPEHADLIPLTTAPAPWVGVGDRFVIGPLVEGMLAAQPRAFVLAASENRVRLIDASATHAEEIDVPGLPDDLRSAARLDVGGDRETLAHLRISEDPDERLRAYAREIHHAVEEVRRPARAVLILAAAEPLLSILAATAPEPKLVVGRLTGNHDDDGPEQLADLADPHIRAHRDRWRGARDERMAESPPDRRLRDLDAIEKAAVEGRIDTLFIDTDWRAPAADGESGAGGARRPDRGDELIRSALAHDATVIPEHVRTTGDAGAVAALLRYTVVS
ncbi:hypothetical protein [Microbacterium sp. ABRD28]|uniref:baeRF3 domain-containing protein n=1 Tax=Microbacterium sp. ABRD28 TaxID=2268461 RepID=UPI000F54E261|nr:hypothetical protein [Microbacterium sp. ABRD28]AZC12413.1 hypothetical protein DT073_00615 [Microbacterium sp. ABRD28]